jgi:hypothetical protein
MADKKKQHYVPRFYLKNFSINSEGKAIGIYNVEKNRFIPMGNQKNQAYQDYFYGEDEEIENMLSTVESKASSIIRNIICEESLPGKLKADHHTLLVHTIFQWARTLYAADEIEEMLNKLIKTKFKRSEKYKDLIDKVTINQKYPGVLPLTQTMISLPLLYDLNFILFINHSNIPFISSDHPVVLYNQFLEKRRDFASNTGFACKGLQIFFPISPKYCINFYDQDVYTFANPINRTIKLLKDRDVDAINQLQCVNSYTNLYFNEYTSIDYISELFKKAKKYRRKIKATVEESPMKRISDDKYHSYVLTYTHDVKINLKLSFISIKKSAKKIKLQDKTIVVRNEWMLKVSRHFSSLVYEEKYGPGEFDRFLKECYGINKDQPVFSHLSKNLLDT